MLPLIGWIDVEVVVMTKGSDLETSSGSHQPYITPILLCHRRVSVPEIVLDMNLEQDRRWSRTGGGVGPVVEQDRRWSERHGDRRTGKKEEMGGSFRTGFIQYGHDSLHFLSIH